MLNEIHVLTRSKSEEKLIKSNVLSPTPVRDYSANVLDEITGLNNLEGEFFSKNTFAVRKHQSFGILGLEEKWYAIKKPFRLISLNPSQASKT